MSQDYYIYTGHFMHLKRRGVYFGIAANEPIHISNTYFMDACIGWAGECVETFPRFLVRLWNDRYCAIAPTCVSDKEGQNVEFALQSGQSGILATNKNKHE